MIVNLKKKRVQIGYLISLITHNFPVRCCCILVYKLSGVSVHSVATWKPSFFLVDCFPLSSYQKFGLVSTHLREIFADRSRM